MVMIVGGNNPGNTAGVDNEGRLSARAVASTEQDESATNGTSFNYNTSDVTLTDDNETPLFYIKNESEANEVKISRIFLTALASTGGTGPLRCNIYKNITGGTILDQTNEEVTNFNFGSGKTIGIVVKKGGTGITWTGGEQTNIEFLFPDVSIRTLTNFESIVLPRGASLLFTATPPTGNTSIVIASGTNIFQALSE